MTAPDRADIEAAVEAAKRFADAMRYQMQRQDGCASRELKCTSVGEDGEFVHLTEPQLTAVLAELERLERVEQARDDSPRMLRHAFAAGWHSHSAAMNGALATVGFEDREAAAKDWFRVAAADLAARDGQDGEPR